MTRRTWLTLVACAAACTAFTAPSVAQAQSYPSKPIRFMLNVSVGVLSDIVMRVAVVELAKQMGQPWVVENRPGGNFVIAATACKGSAPDGYTVCLVNEQSMSLNPHVITKLSYDPETDFKPITNLYVQVSGLVAAATLGVNSVADLTHLAASKPGSLNFGTLGPGTSQDILRLWINGKYKTDFVGVPYKGMPLILNGMLAGENAVTQSSLGSAASYIAGAKVKLLAVNSAKRLSKLPDVPTFHEAGLGEFIDVQGRFWWGLVVPAGTPDAIVQRLNAEFTRLFRTPRFMEVLEDQFLDPLITSPEEFAAFLKRDRDRDGEVVKRFKVPKI